MKETGAHAVKLEGGQEVVESVNRILAAGIPVMGHLGLTPQSIYKFGTYTVRAREERRSRKIKSRRKNITACRLFCNRARKNSRNIGQRSFRKSFNSTIGIGAGKFCDGQVLVMHDMLGINTEFKPRFLRQYLNLGEQITGAVQKYINDVKSNDFPNEQEQY